MMLLVRALMTHKTATRIREVRCIDASQETVAARNSSFVHSKLFCLADRGK